MNIWFIQAWISVSTKSSKSFTLWKSLEIGRYLSTLDLSPDLYIGEIGIIFQMEGKQPSSIERLNKRYNGKNMADLIL